MSNNNKYNISLTLRERLVVHKLSITQEQSFLDLANQNHAELRAELEDDDDDITPMEYVEGLLERLTLYDIVRQFPNCLFDHPQIVNSEAVVFALNQIGEIYPDTQPEVDSLIRKLELIRSIETNKN